jgi:hypothetical protein
MNQDRPVTERLSRILFDRFSCKSFEKNPVGTPFLLVKTGVRDYID